MEETLQAVRGKLEVVGIHRTITQVDITEIFFRGAGIEAEDGLLSGSDTEIRLTLLGKKAADLMQHGLVMNVSFDPLDQHEPA
jgi:hypothetical protein